MYTRFIDLFYSLYKLYTTPHHLQHTTDTMDQTKVHAHTQDQPCPHKIVPKQASALFEHTHVTLSIPKILSFKF